MKKTIYTYSSGGYTDITSRAFDTLEEAQAEMRADYENLMEGYDEEDNYGQLEEKRAVVDLEAMEYPEDKWGASITEAEISVEDSWNREGFPFEDGTYLVTLDGEICGEDKPITSICGFYDGKWDEPKDLILAWMPLPEPANI